MATTALTSACITSSSLPHTQGNINRSIDVCDASFSSYISNAKQINIQTLAESTHSRSTTTTKLQPYPINSHRKLTEDGEISIFDAEKYFTGGMDEEKSRTTETGGAKHQSAKDDRLDLQGIKVKIKPAMTSRSEESLKSQSTSSPGLIKDRTPSWKEKVYGKHFISTFSWKCPCSDRKSVSIDQTFRKTQNSRNGKKTMNSEGSCTKQLIMEHPDHIERDPTNFNGSIQTNTEASVPCSFNKSHPGLLKDENFEFTVTKSVVANLATDSRYEEVLKKGNRQRSFEVFGSPISDKGDNTSGLESRLAIFAWDVNPRVEDIQAPYESSIVHDNDSDSSSDLFEIKNLPEKSKPIVQASGY